MLTPNTLLRRKLTPILEEDLEKIGEEDVTKQMGFLQKNKEQLQKRFMKEYIHAFDEKQQRSTGKTDKTSNSSVAERRYKGQGPVEAGASSNQNFRQGWHSVWFEAEARERLRCGATFTTCVT